jgi:ABC-type lipoprotein export system ATPase subunit/ribosomal protein S18 acetylase RimI-like enzyme
MINKLVEVQVIHTNWGKKGSVTKTLHLQYKNSPKKILFFEVPRSACVTEGDIIFYQTPLDMNKLSMEKDYVYIRCKNGFAQLTPIYNVRVNVKIGSLILPITIKEISQKDEFDSYLSLSKFHYRNKLLFGRHSSLVAVSCHPLLPKVVGYIDLATAFFVNTPRKKILDEPTRLDSVFWNSWSKDTIKENIPLFVRIARCVVHPELRSSGIAQTLVTHAANFAKTHWQSAHCKPYFLEISADMLRYVPFVAKAGMLYVGETEGNLKRIAKDLRYLSENESRFQTEIFKGNIFGILDTKFSQLAKATAASHASGEDNIGEFIKAQIEHPTLDGWAQLAGVLSHPKPHYMMGLNKEAVELIAQRTKKRNIEPPYLDRKVYIDQICQTRLQESIKVQNVSVEIRFNVRRTEVTHHIERAFEISLDDLLQPVLKDISVEIKAGEIVVLTGLSGTGKTTLLHLLASELAPTNGSIIFPNNLKVGQLHGINSPKPLIEIIGEQDPGKGIYWLGVVGLSEPFSYVKPFSALSAGQKYRAMLAKLLVQGANLWLIDEFCENLDLLNTNLLAKKISSVAREVGATVIAASSDASRFVTSLTPNRVIVLKGATDTPSYRILTGKKYIDQLKF